MTQNTAAISRKAGMPAAPSQSHLPTDSLAILRTWSERVADAIAINTRDAREALQWRGRS